MNNNQNTTTKLKIQQKLFQVQQQAKNLFREQENKYLKMKYFNELQVLEVIKPLLEKYKLLLVMSDDRDKFSYKKEGNLYEVSYLKHALLYDVEDESENGKNIIPSSFWACGSNINLSQAKGSAETYAMKYFLSKFFLIPVRDDDDPDSTTRPTETAEQIKARHANKDLNTKY